MTVPGMVLSQPLMQTSASRRCPRVTSSMESATTSRAHRDTVRHRYGVHLDRRATGRPDALLDPGRQPSVVEVARHDLNPRVRYPDERSSEIFVRVADRPHHGARTSAGRTIDECFAAYTDLGHSPKA